MDKLDIQLKQKQFFKIIFGDVIGDGNNLKDNNYIRIFQTNKNKTIVKFFNNIDSLVQYTSNRCYDINTYFELATTNGESGQEKDLIYRTVLAWDFDKKDFNNLDARDIMFRFKSLGLWYHVLVDSGNGYHAYICINPTEDIKKVQEVQKAIGKLLGADLNAVKSTQVLRVPYSFNIKNKPKRVNIIKMYDKDTIKRKNIDYYYNRFCCNARDKNTDNRATEFVLNNTNMLYCINDILGNGSIEGNRNNDLIKIVVSLRRLNKSYNDIKHICKEWNNKNNPGLMEQELNYQIEYIYKNIDKCSYDCKECKHKKECWNRIESNFVFDDDEEFINIEYKVAKKLKYSRRSNNMNGNELLIFNVLKHWKGKELNINDIIKHLTYKDKCALSEKTIREALKALEEKETIIRKQGIRKQGIKDTYTINPIKCDIENTFNISYFPTLICIYGVITPSELRLYHYMRYKHDLEVKDNKANGNIFRINQSELAAELGTDQKNISVMIKNLIDAKILEIWDIKKNEKGFDYYTYRLVK